MRYNPKSLRNRLNNAVWQLQGYIHATQGKRAETTNLYECWLLANREVKFETSVTDLLEILNMGTQGATLRASIKRYHERILQYKQAAEQDYANTTSNAGKYSAAGRIQAFRFILIELSSLLERKHRSTYHV